MRDPATPYTPRKVIARLGIRAFVKFARGTPWKFIGVQAAVALVLMVVGLAVAVGSAGGTGWLAPFLVTFDMAAVGWVVIQVYFFRDPERTPGTGVVSPADGRVRACQSSGNGATVSVFLGVFNVHVVRAPIAGRVSSVAHKAGGKRFAFSKESEHNERVLISIAGEGESCSLMLIAGAFADRILPYVDVGSTVAKGERIGIIKFGSRVDLDYASGSPHALAVKLGNTVIGGQTSILNPAGEAAPS